MLNKISTVIIELAKVDFDKAERTTAVTRDLGFRFNLNIVLCF